MAIAQVVLELSDDEEDYSDNDEEESSDISLTQLNEILKTEDSLRILV